MGDLLSSSILMFVLSDSLLKSIPLFKITIRTTLTFYTRISWQKVSGMPYAALGSSFQLSHFL